MKRRCIYVLVFLALTGYIVFITARIEPVKFKNLETEGNGATTPFELKSGDILVRPNWGWLPGSCEIQGGMKFGHVAIVTEGATGNTPEEALANATVVEALFYDQVTGKFQFNKKDQIRIRKAISSFGSRFKGDRYRLRMRLKEDQISDIRKFLVNQLGGGYNIFSQKRQYDSSVEKRRCFLLMKNDSWNCATLAWQTYFLIANVDIDANQGMTIFPNDIVASNTFDLPDGRILF